MSTYILQKDLPEAKAGTEYNIHYPPNDWPISIKPTVGFIEHKIKEVKCNNYDSLYSEEFIKNNPEWFKLKEDSVTPYEKHYGKFIKYSLDDGIITFSFQNAVFQHHIAALVMLLNQFAVKFENSVETIRK